LKLNNIFPGKDETNALGAMKDYVDKNTQYAADVANRKLFGEVTPEAKAIGEKSKLEAERYGAIHKMAPHLTPGVVFSLVNSGASDQVVAKIGLAALSVEKLNAEQEDKDRAWWLDAWAGAKTGTRWLSALAQLPFDYMQNAPAVFLEPANKPTGNNVLDFHFKNPYTWDFLGSTDFGAAVMNPTSTGEGIFSIGGEAAKFKTRKQMDFSGSIPLTIEAGAGENTAFEADPDEINTVAMQILATKDISYEEAYDEANRLIRSNARLPMSLSGIVPLAIPKDILPTPGNFLQAQAGESQYFEFGDIGTPEYAMASAVASIALAVALPDPTDALLLGIVKPLLSYAKGIKYVDEAGNFLMDSRNIAQNGAEAAHMANIDTMNVLVNDFEAAGLSLADDAVETLTPQPGTWYHGSRSGPIEGDIVSIDDPRYPNPDGNVYGPGFYLTESPIIGETYASINKGGTRAMSPGEEQIYEGLVPQVNPDALGAPTVSLGRAEAELPAGVPPGTVYRFNEAEGYNPNLLDPTVGLADQTTPEFISELANQWVDVNNANMPSLDLLGPDDPVSQLLESLDIETVLKDNYDSVLDLLNNQGISAAQAAMPSDNSVLQQISEMLRNKAKAGELNDFVNGEFSLTAATVQTRLANHVAEFVIQNGRYPSSLDELKSFKGVLSFDEITTKPISAANGDKLLNNGTRSLTGIGEEILPISNEEKLFARLRNRVGEINIAYADEMRAAQDAGREFNLSFDAWLDSTPGLKAEYENITSMSNFYMQGKVKMSDYLAPLFDNRIENIFISNSESLSPRVNVNGFTPEVGALFEEMMLEASTKFDPVVSERIARMNVDDVTKKRLDELSIINSGGMENTDLVSPSFWSPGVKTEPRTWLALNTWLAENGIDGFKHEGGHIAGGGNFLHKVTILFDPMKHIDIADVLTGERLPVNEAINAARESGELATRAGELRSQIDELEAMRAAGHIPGYGDMVDPETFNSFFTQSRAGKYAADKIWAVSQKVTSKLPSDAKDMAWYELWKMFDGKLPLNIMDDILNAGSKSEMVSIINKNVGYTPGLSNLSDLNFGLSKTFDRLKAVSRVDTLMDKAGEFAGPLFGRSPKSTTLDIFGSPRAQLQALKDLDAFITTGVRGKVNITNEGFNVKARVMSKFAEAIQSGDRDALFNISQQIAGIINKRILDETGDTLQAQAASDLWNNSFDAASGIGIYNVGEAGLRTDNGYAAVLAENGQYELRGMQHGGPALLSELQRTPIELPDVQQLRRMTSFLGVFTGKQGLQRVIKKSELRTNALKKFGVDLSKKDLEKLGDLRIPIRLVDFAMTKVWKNSKKLSLAYGVRNTMEAQARLAFSDMDNFFSHPADHILVATHNRIPDDIALGEEFNPEGWRGLGKAHESAGEGYQEMLSQAYYGSDGRMDMVTSQFRNSDFVVYSKDDPTKWAKAGGYELRQLYNDPIARRLAGGASVEDVIKWLNSDDAVAQKSLREIKNTMSNGEVFYDAAGNAKVVPVNPTPENIRLRIESMQKERISVKTASDPALTEVVSNATFDGLPAFNAKGEPSKELVEYLKSQVANTDFPTFYKGRGTDPKFLKAKTSQLDQATRMFFDGFMGRAHNILDRSPLWRQEYTKEVNRLAVLLSPEAAAEMKQLIIDRTLHYDNIAQSKGFARTFTIKDYLGKNVDADELFESLDNAKGWMSRDEMHALANSLTLDKIEGLLFDANARNSITDAARIVTPFGAAWTEVTKTWVGLLAKNPQKVVNLGRKYEILTGEKEHEVLHNKGLMHKDPISGDMMYSLPMSGSVFKLMNAITGGQNTGSNYNLEAPLKGMNMAFNFTPGFSPIVGFPLGQLLYKSPKMRDFATFLMPYGPSKSPIDASEYAPGWVNKIAQAFLSNPRSSGVYADTLSEVIRVEMATGKYDLSDPEQREQFNQEAEHKARILTMMRGIGQALGPSSPTVEAKVRTKSGDIFSGHLTSEFHKLQSEDYDTAVERFIYMFGEEAYGYMAGKTKSLMSGVEATSEFSKWELENADLFDTPYGDIAGYFAPKGSNYDHAAWLYQIATGKRERVPPIPTQIEMAEFTLGMHKYRSLVEMAGPRPNGKAQAALAAQKLLLEQEYPGMVSQSSLDVEAAKKNMKMLRLAVEDQRLSKNETAIALKEYLDFRDMAMRGAAAAGNPWGSDKAAGLRATLRFQGQLLVKETPEFARVFDRLLLPELEK